MSRVSIDQEMCTDCGYCVAICGRGCFRKTDTGIMVEADETNCHLCGHCVAICPARAIVHRQMNMERFEELEETAPIGYEQMIRHIKSRRSHSSH
ncbi:MAG: 4Fe-4S binding protein [Deltaproteobacteria bacterium]|nr:4Fe-4S binding protein [Deltaproteobacteria bacterium]MBW1961307.1 4Fe-4S binding protein [Deltaproteobacteria bacterium]MBW2152436.1 4Fe-4S binding protein [Deltaproteobacteria bacterium]